MVSYCDLNVEKIIQEPKRPSIDLMHFIGVYIFAIILLDLFK